MTDLSGKVALITGAGAAGPGWSNGKAAAVSYARAGAKVLSVDLKAAEAEATAALIRDEGGEAVAFAGDVGSNDDVAAMVGACMEHFGRIDILHNNVGIVEPGGPVELSEAAWRRSLDINVTGMFLTCKHAIPHFLELGGGVITNISSVAAVKYTGWPAVAYAASKGAVNALSQNIAVQYAAQGIRCNAIMPGFLNTPLVKASLGEAYDNQDMDQIIAERDAKSPTGKMGDAWDVAALAVFLAGEGGKYINGALLPVDGGLIPS